MAEKIVLESGPETRNAAPATPPESHREAALTSRDPREYLRSRPRARMLLIGAILLVLVGAIWFWRYLTSYESTDDAQVDGHLMLLSARISGYVLKVNVDDNQYRFPAGPADFRRTGGVLLLRILRGQPPRANGYDGRKVCAVGQYG